MKDDTRSIESSESVEDRPGTHSGGSGGTASQAGSSTGGKKKEGPSMCKGNEPLAGKDDHIALYL